MTKKQKPRTGPAPDTLKIEGPWEAAVKTALQREKPKDGWPVGPTRYEKRKKKPG